MNSKNVHNKRDRSTNAQKQYVRGITHNLSLQRLTDQEISDYLRTEKKIDLARITINGIRRNIEKQAEKWYIELRDSRYKYIATYKERLDSLLCYQKRLNEIVEFYREEHLYPDTVIKAIAELHRIEISIFNLWKQLPDLQIVDVDNNNKNRNKQSQGYMSFDEWAEKNTPPRVSYDCDYSDEENGQYYWDLHKRYEEYVSNAKAWGNGNDKDELPEPIV